MAAAIVVSDHSASDRVRFIGANFGKDGLRGKRLLQSVVLS
jgi:hypothetical protein